MANNSVESRLTKATQKHGILGVVSLFLSLCLIVSYALVMDGRRAETIAQLSVALSEQREQFTDCTTDRPVVPASTCEEPVAEPPAEIVKKVEEKADPVLAPTPIMGPTGPAGPSAYQVALANGFQGTQPAWLGSLRGAQGMMGVPGLSGSDGRNGLNGSNGLNGVNGANGTPGKSAYQSALDSGFVGTEAEWVSSLRGRDGSNGTDGADGSKGDKGDTAGPTQEQVNEAIRIYCDAHNNCKGPQGDDGEDGSDGTDGSDGADGKPIDLCPESNFTRQQKTVLTLGGEVQTFTCAAGTG